MSLGFLPSVCRSEVPNRAKLVAPLQPWIARLLAILDTSPRCPTAQRQMVVSGVAGSVVVLAVKEAEEEVVRRDEVLLASAAPRALSRRRGMGGFSGGIWGQHCF